MARYPEMNGRAAIVTGAGGRSSIGAAAALAFAEQGAHVVCADIDVAGAGATARAIAESGGDAIAVRADVTRPDDVEAMTRTCIERFGGIDVLVNSAGGFRRVESILEINPETWDDMLALNLTSVFLCCRAVYPTMRERGAGRIINVSSVQGRMPSQLNPAYYSAAKAGALAFTKVLAQELAPHGVTVNAVAPGATMSERFERLRGADGVEALRRRIPLRRIPTPEEQAAVILFLASNAASYITGATLDVNGGSVML